MGQLKVESIYFVDYLLPIFLYQGRKAILFDAIIRVHLKHFRFSWCPHDLHYLQQVSNTSLSDKERLTYNHL